MHLVLIYSIGLSFLIKWTYAVSHEEVLKMYKLVEPYQLPNKTSVNDLEKIENCECPRVYWPACANDNITYVNACIVHCLKKKLRRFGPCITYRRSSERKIVIFIPSAWRDVTYNKSEIS